MNIAGIVASADMVKVALLEHLNERFRFLAYQVFNLQTGNRAEAYRVLHQQLLDWLSGRGTNCVCVQGSAGSQFAAKKGLLEGAEVRGVAMAAAAAANLPVHTMIKGSISRTFGDRKVSEYVKDDTFWVDQSLRDVPKGMRPACFVVLAKFLKTE